MPKATSNTKSPAIPVKKSEVVAPKEALWKGKSLDVAKADLVKAIQQGMLTVYELKAQPFGTLRKQKEWEKRSRPFIAELEQIEGRPVSVDRFRPGR